MQAVSGGQVLHTFEVTREVNDIHGRQHKVRPDSRDDVAAPLHRNQEELLQRPQPCLLDGLPNHGRVLSHLWAATKPLSQPKARIPFWRTAAKAAQRLPPISYLQPHKQLLHRVIRLFGLAAEYLFCQGRQQRRGGYQDVQNPKDRVREAVHRDVKHAKDRHSGVLLGPVCLETSNDQVGGGTNEGASATKYRGERKRDQKLLRRDGAVTAPRPAEDQGNQQRHNGSVVEECRQERHRHHHADLGHEQRAGLPQEIGKQRVQTSGLRDSLRHWKQDHDGGKPRV
mmetsp:Transcript_26280/g.73725  ORF Transcript_26280/g.73725 Transcript_26280/m.73725 type:complete len:284 (-) Transcript_26280:712-1563(-)